MPRRAHGARYKGRRAGSFGHAAAFSFYPSKNLGAFGDGGMITTNDDRAAEQLRLLRNYGQRVKYHHAIAGTNSRLDALQAAAATPTHTPRGSHVACGLRRRRPASSTFIIST